jgi:hypothetical protein
MKFKIIQQLLGLKAQTTSQWYAIFLLIVKFVELVKWVLIELPITNNLQFRILSSFDMRSSYYMQLVR